jgi:hypothetical protein
LGAHIAERLINALDLTGLSPVEKRMAIFCGALLAGELREGMAKHKTIHGISSSAFDRFCAPLGMSGQRLIDGLREMARQNRARALAIRAKREAEDVR